MANNGKGIEEECRLKEERKRQVIGLEGRITLLFFLKGRLEDARLTKSKQEVADVFEKFLDMNRIVLKTWSELIENDEADEEENFALLDKITGIDFKVEDALKNYNDVHKEWKIKTDLISAQKIGQDVNTFQTAVFEESGLNSDDIKQFPILNDVVKLAIVNKQLKECVCKHDNEHRFDLIAAKVHTFNCDKCEMSYLHRNVCDHHLDVDIVKHRDEETESEHSKTSFTNQDKQRFVRGGGIVTIVRYGEPPTEVFEAKAVYQGMKEVLSRGRTKKKAEQQAIMLALNSYESEQIVSLVDTIRSSAGDSILRLCWAMFADVMKKSGHILRYCGKDYRNIGALIPDVETAIHHRDVLLKWFPAVVEKYSLNDSHSDHTFSEVFEYEIATKKTIRAKYWERMFANEPIWMNEMVLDNIIHKLDLFE